MDKKILHEISYGMYVVTTKDSGCIINTLTQITSKDPIVTISLNKENYTNLMIKKNKKFAVSILSEKTDPNLISTFGFQTSKQVDKFQDFAFEKVEEMKVIQEETVGYLLCEVKEIIDCNTHDIFVAHVIDGKKTNDNPPMTYRYYHEVIKGKAPKKAPTFVEEEVDSKEEIYVCDVCGYIHKGPLPDDFICPICGMDRTHFQKQN